MEWLSVRALAMTLSGTLSLGGLAAAEELNIGREAFELLTQPTYDSSDAEDGAKRAIVEELQQRMLSGMKKSARGKKSIAGANGEGDPGSINKMMQDVPAPSSVIVRMKDPALQRMSHENRPLPDEVLGALSQAAGAPLVAFRAMAGGAHVLHIGRIVDRPEYDLIVQRLAGLPSVDTVSPNERVQSQMTSFDPRFGDQWSLWRPVAGVPIVGIDAVSAWDFTRGSSSVVVAVVDSGVGPHSDFASRLLPGHDFVSNANTANDGNGRDADATDPGDYRYNGQCLGKPAGPSSWHGTHVAGTIAASGNNGIGIAGIDWNARILPVRVLGACGGDWSDIVDGMIWAAGLPVPGVPANPYPARVINMSLGGPGQCNSFFQEQIKRAKANGAFVVVAAGNKSDLADYYVPASCQEVITVAATGPDGDLAMSYSNYSFRLEIAAPGGDMYAFGQIGGIVSTINSGSTTPMSSTWGYKDGTSMAAPHVSGVASLMLAVNPFLYPEEIYYIIQLSAQPFLYGSFCAFSGICGAGILSASGAVGFAALLKPYALVFEFHNRSTNHYFRTGWADEAKSINNGSAGPNWYDTLDYYYTYRQPNATTLPVCRFYSQNFNSHFYTIDQAECEFVKKDTNWRFEGFAFHAVPQRIGGCPPDTSPVYRVYNNRFAQNDVNHRFTTRLSVYNDMKLKGWLQEGIAFCVPIG